MKDNLTRLRKLKGLRQQDLADALGIARNTYTQYELGRRLPDIETIRKLAAYLDVSVDYLLGGTVPETVQLLDLFAQKELRLLIGDHEVTERERPHLAALLRSFAAAMNERG